MAVIKRSISLDQYHNPKFDQMKEDHPSDNPKHIFRIVKTTNVLQVVVPVHSPTAPTTSRIISTVIEAYLTPEDVQCLIDNGVDVSITRTK